VNQASLGDQDQLPGGGWSEPWSHLKRSLAGLAKRNVSQLTAPVKTRLKPMPAGHAPRPWSD
jgi:hypothetical protein